MGLSLRRIASRNTSQKKLRITCMCGPEMHLLRVLAQIFCKLRTCRNVFLIGALTGQKVSGMEGFSARTILLTVLKPRGIFNPIRLVLCYGQSGTITKEDREKR